MGSHRQAGVGVRCYSCAREESILHITPVNTVPHPSQALLSLTQSTTLPVCLIHHPSCPLLSLTMLCPLPLLSPSPGEHLCHLLPQAPSSIPSFVINILGLSESPSTSSTENMSSMMRELVME